MRPAIRTLLAAGLSVAGATNTATLTPDMMQAIVASVVAAPIAVTAADRNDPNGPTDARARLAR